MVMGCCGDVGMRGCGDVGVWGCGDVAMWGCCGDVVILATVVTVVMVMVW